MTPPQKIEIKESPVGGKGKMGVFATEDIANGEIIEVAPILVLQFTDFIDTRWNLLFDYYFWMDDEVVLALGYGSMYNHSGDPSVSYKLDIKKQTITFTALRGINIGEEIFFNYRGAEKGKTPLWFERKDVLK